jgi:hypothetical protein
MSYLSNLQIIYSWPEGQSDLDTVTTFVGQSVGYGHIEVDAPPYITYSTDNLGPGPEIVTIDLQQAYLDGAIGPFVNIPCYVDWYPPKGGSGPATITWIYDGESYSETIYPNSIDHGGGIFGTLVKNLGIGSGGKFAPYSNNIIYEFEPEFNLNTEDLTTTAIGYAVHKFKDVTFSFDITDRKSNTLNSKQALFENPFVESVDIDILDISGNIISGDYVKNSFENTFTFTETENIAVFGQYTKNFGIGISTVSLNTNLHSSEYYVYANPLEINKISVTDGTGSWLNYNPNQYQSYIPYTTSGSSINGQLVTNNALYLSGYQDTVSGYYANISGSVPFAFLTGESLKIDWGDSQIQTIFQQTGVSGYSGILGISTIETNTGDFLLTTLVDPTGLNGQSYSFITGYTYPNGVTGIYDVKFYYSGLDSTGNELIKTIQYRIPDELKPQGKPQIGSNLTGKIQLDIQFLNNPYYTSSDQFQIYISTGSGVPINTGYLRKTIPVFNDVQDYTFYLDQNSLISNTNYWFNIVASGQIETGYGWEIGPYTIYDAPPVKSNIRSESFTLTNGNAEINMDFITGVIPTSSTTTIDTLIKGSGYSYEYLAQFKDQSGCYCSSKLFIVDNTSGLDVTRTGLSFSEYAISDNSFITYSVSDDSSNIYLNAQLNSPTGYYKLYKTSI